MAQPAKKACGAISRRIDFNRGVERKEKGPRNVSAPEAFSNV